MGTIYAAYNWWGGGAPYVFEEETSTVYYIPYNSSGLCPAAGASKTTQVVASAEGVTDLESQLLDAKQKAIAGQDAEAISLFKAIAEEDAQSKEAGLALIELGRMARQRRDAPLALYLSDLAGARSPHRAVVLGLLVDYHQAQAEDVAALDLAKTLEQEEPGTWHAFYAQWQMFNLHLEAERYVEAAAVLARMEPTRETEADVLTSAQERLADIAGEGFAAGSPFAKQAAQEPTEGGLELAVYPNPFNPQATIEYTLPEASYVLLKVYNLQGREVATLVQHEEEEGEHTAVFDARTLASGLYVYRLEAVGRVLAGTMLLMK